MSRVLQSSGLGVWAFRPGIDGFHTRDLAGSTEQPVVLKAFAAPDGYASLKRALPVGSRALLWEPLQGLSDRYKDP